MKISSSPRRRLNVKDTVIFIALFKIPKIKYPSNIINIQFKRELLLSLLVT